jgi:hypothetical protein
MKAFKRGFPILIGVLIFSANSFAADDAPSKGFPPSRIPGRHHRPKMQLTADQKECLEGKLGKPGESPRPSRENMEAALKSCGIQKASSRPPVGNNEGKSGE